jgi:hypothetical protein
MNAINTKADMLAMIEGNISELEFAKSNNSPADMILAWPSANLGVRFNADGKPQAVRVDMATIVRRDDRREVFNGRNDRAVFVLRSTAIEAALVESYGLLEVLAKA